MARVVVGGTFECLHDGHKELIKKAFELANGEELDIGLTSNEMANKRPRQVPDYNIRKKKLIDYINEIAPGQNYTILELNDPYGKTLKKDYDYIVVSPETYPVALKINNLRHEKNMRVIDVVRVEFVLADDEKPISSTRIVQGEIDIHGHLRSHS
ncbi:phosphopantetheine adenylyltransferase [Methanolobus bombayensis]|uniref:phosphopantetheine adenylyltransferase n=1 Tax=Methanolobus bombayensis TaxID=38023 RepID=UPI001AEB6802|nr:phosphopantetheine adenylyltransferase [Methanolobus bombayensis]MBP1907894.1 pantetheine-phosphate adenylyltransferase [Methanolobus bombayensis]